MLKHNIKFLKKGDEYFIKNLLKDLKFLSHNQYKPSTVKNELLNQRHCGK